MAVDGAVLLPARLVRWVGALLVVTGVALPAALIISPDDTASDDGPAGRVSLRPEMVVVPAGSFMMGSPAEEELRDDDETLHGVTLTEFAISRTEVTQGQYFTVMGERPVAERDDTVGNSCATAGVGDDLPVVCVDWFEAVRFANQLSTLEGLAPVYDIRGDAVEWLDGDGYRLPTEAEWEYAARAGLTTPFVGTSNREAVCVYANVADQSGLRDNPAWEVFPCDDGFAALAPVGAARLLENPWRLHGMGGNAAEWVWDWYGPYAESPAEDPRGPVRGGDRVVRGGSWWGAPQVARAAIRSWGGPALRGVSLGFRVARSLPSGFLPSNLLPGSADTAPPLGSSERSLPTESGSR